MYHPKYWEKWVEVKSPFKVKTDITVAPDGTITAVASAVNVYDPVGILPDIIKEYTATATAKCHPDDEYNRSYGVRLASNRARRKFYDFMANRINERLEQLDTYLAIIHNKTVAMKEETDVLLLEQMDIKELPQEG